MKKILLSFFAALTVFFSFAPYLEVAAASGPSASPAPPWYNTSFPDWYSKVYDSSNPSEIFGERYTAAQVQWVIYGLFAYVLNGVVPSSVLACILANGSNVNSCVDLIKSIVRVSNPRQEIANQNVWSEVFSTDRPLSGISYVKEKVQNFSIVPVAHAQQVGFGFDALTPIQVMWKAFRDIAFGLFVIVAIVFSFMIMFRVKLSPQTVITVQSALPKMVFSLILVTFSYAIAGFLIDLMYVVIGLISLAASSIFPTIFAGWNFQASAYFNLMTLGQPFGGWAGLIPGVNPQFGVMGLILLYFMMFFLPLIILLTLITAPLLALGPGGALIWGLFVFLIVIIAAAICLWTGIKVIWALLKAFVNIVLLTIFAPIQIAAGNIIPSFGFSQWLRSYVSNLSVFVVTGALFLFSFLFIIWGVVVGILAAVAGNPATQIVSALLTPFLGSAGASANNFIQNSSGNAAWPPLLGTGNGGWIGLLFLGVSFVLFTLTPKAAEIIQGLLSGRPFAYGTAIGEAFGGVGLAYNRTIGPGMADFDKYRSQMMVKNLIKNANDFIEKPENVKLRQATPKPIKDYLSQNASTGGWQPRS